MSFLYIYLSFKIKFKNSILFYFLKKHITIYKMSKEDFCLITDEKQVKDLKSEINQLKSRWDDDMGTIKNDLNRLVVFINNVSQRYDTIKPTLDGFTEKLDKINNKQLTLTELLYRHQKPMYISLMSFMTIIIGKKLLH
tara:strand:- start:660 stop:1076 length:417 start_codon:yes stop_codon:yes gene_type:complete